ncbi:unnamed protein product [Lathyrus oleraceus]
MSITLNDVSCLLHLPNMGRFLDHWRMTKGEALEMMLEYRGADPGEVMDELDKTRGTHARFVYLEKVYEDVLLSAQQADDDEKVALHKSHVLRAYLLYLVGTAILWTIVPLIQTSTYVNSWISNGSMSTTGGRLV